MRTYRGTAADKARSRRSADKRRARNHANGLSTNGKKRLLDCPRRYWTDEMKAAHPVDGAAGDVDGLDELDRKALADPEVRRGRAV